MDPLGIQGVTNGAVSFPIESPRFASHADYVGRIISPKYRANDVVSVTELAEVFAHADQTDLVRQPLHVRPHLDRLRGGGHFRCDRFWLSVDWRGYDLFRFVTLGAGG